MKPIVDLAHYKWNGLSTFTEGTTKYDRSRNLVESVDPLKLAAYASKVAGGDECRVESLFTLGGCHVVRMVTFTNGRRWIARFRIPLAEEGKGQVETNDCLGDLLMQREVDCLRLMSEQTTVPVPRVIASGTSASGFGTPFIMMECIPGNCAMDLNFDFVPQQFRASFFSQMANAQVQIGMQLFPMIGSIKKLDNGNIEIGPLPAVGGPFKTASAFLRAWAAVAKFPLAEDRVREACGPFADEVWQRTSEFPQELSRMADQVCAQHDRGPFPLFHTDFGHNNIVVDPDYNMLGVIDWEHAFAAPWQMVDYPLTVRVTPQPMDLPSNYDEEGRPKDESLRATYAEREEYLEAVKQVERALNAPPRLSNILGNRKLQDVATAMRLFNIDGKMGFYTRVLDSFRESA